MARQTSKPRKTTKSSTDANDSQKLVRRHLRIGWLGLLVFLTLGIALEAMHGFKLEMYLDFRNQTRRLMWTLSHTHGTLFSLVHIAFAASIAVLPQLNPQQLKLTSIGLTSALVLMPLGFFLGGLWFYGGDPGFGILFVPAGGIALLLAVAVMAWMSWRT